ncbi:MAG: cation transporter [Phycisphaerales bacterium]|nr:cation transporter [Phycisphaerales bacterium]
MPNGDSTSRRAGRMATAGLLANILLAALKLVAGIAGRSSALVADAVESMTDILGSIVIWGGLRYGRRPPDEDHPFGHGRAESLAALAVGAMVVLAGVALAVKSVRELLAPSSTPAAFTLLVLVVVVVVKEVLFRVAHRTGTEVGSTAVKIDAWHHRSDAITSVAAFIGISVALIGGEGWESADPWAALLASGVVAFNGVVLFRTPFRELMDEQPHDLRARIDAVALEIDGVRSVEKTFVRKLGMRYLAEMHVRVDGDLPVREGHAIAGRVRAGVRERLPRIADVLIHVEPEPTGQVADGERLPTPGT